MPRSEMQDIFGREPEETSGWRMRFVFMRHSGMWACLQDNASCRDAAAKAVLIHGGRSKGRMQGRGKCQHNSAFFIRCLRARSTKTSSGCRYGPGCFPIGLVVGGPRKMLRERPEERLQVPKVAGLRLFKELGCFLRCPAKVDQGHRKTGI